MRHFLTLIAVLPGLSLAGCSSTSGNPISEQEAKTLANESLKPEGIVVPLGQFEIRNGFDPDVRDLPQQRLYGRATYQVLQAAQKTGFIELNVRPGNMLGGQLNLPAVATMIEPLPPYADRSQLPKNLSLNVGERMCVEVISLEKVDNAESNNHPVMILKCRVRFSPNDFSVNWEKQIKKSGDKPSRVFWIRQSRGEFLLEWDDFAKSYKISLTDISVPGKIPRADAIDKRISLLRNPQS